MRPEAYLAAGNQPRLRLPFRQVDVFMARPLLGNPVAVVFDADEVPTAEMQAMARWLNLSETVFVLRSQRADARLRYFTPRAELPFAGHPTVGAAHALDRGARAFESGGARLETASGVIEVRRRGTETYWVEGPRYRVVATPIDDGKLARIVNGRAAHANSRPMVIDVGAQWLVVRLDSPQDVAAACIDLERLGQLSRDLGITGLTIYATGAPGTLHTRSFAPAHGVSEDPACGTGNLSVAAHMREIGHATDADAEWLAYQGQAIGRDGRIRLAWRNGRLFLGGEATTIIEGFVTCASHARVTA